MADRENPNTEPENPIFPKDWGDLPGNIPPLSDAEIKRDLENEFFRIRTFALTRSKSRCRTAS